MAPSSNASSTTTTRRLPILVIPGFMSSGLQVESSKLKPEWENERIWINLRSLGWEALPKLRRTRHQTTFASHNSNDENGDDDDVDDDDDDENDDYQDDNRDNSFGNLANTWIQHMMLSPNDLTSENPNVRVRPLPGLDGVDYLSPGALTNHVSYVFGPLINALVKAGWTRCVDLDAMPYDWRIPYKALEERDSYFSSVKQRVEKMYGENENTPVVLVCHSMGAKVGEYFFRWVHRNDPTWTQKYIHTYFPVGGAHLGAPKALRSLLTGDRMGLEAFLSWSDALSFGRSLGSGIGLVPRSLPSTATHCAYLHSTGTLKIKIIESIDVEPFLTKRKKKPNRLQLHLVLGGKKAKSLPAELCSKLSDEEDQAQTGTTITFVDEFYFATTPEKLPQARQGTLWVTLREPGLGTARKNKKTEKSLPIFPTTLSPLEEDNVWKKAFCWHPKCTPGWVYAVSLVWLIQILLAFCFFMVYVTLYLAYLFVLLALFVAYVLYYRMFIVMADCYCISTGGTSSLAFAKPVYLADVLSQPDNSPETVEVELLANETNGCWIFGSRQRSRIVMEVSWVSSQPRQYDGPRICQHEHGRQHASQDTLERILKSKDRASKGAIKAVSGHHALNVEDQPDLINCMRNTYDDDPCIETTHNLPPPPGITRVKSVYGINLPTEVASVYRPHSVFVRNVTATKTQSRLLLDARAKMSCDDDKANGYVIEGGIVAETKDTEQLTHTGERIQCSGDGTVPYWSLQCVHNWQSESCSVNVDELEGAEHREILADKRLHQLLIDYCK